MSTVTAALLAALVYFLIGYGDEVLLSWQCLSRPIVVAPLTGLVLGDFKTGLVMGAGLESIFMGISAIGGAVPADALSSSIIAVAYTILTGADTTTGLGLALPIGTVMSGFNSLVMSLVSAPMAGYWERLAVNNIKNFDWQALLYAAVCKLIPTVVLFVAIAFGTAGLESFLAALPSKIMNGINAASGMMTAVGFAILTSMVWDGQVAMFFFFGYALVAYAGLNTVAIAIIGATIAVTYFFLEKNRIDTKNELLNAGVKTEAGEEDFF